MGNTEEMNQQAAEEEKKKWTVPRGPAATKAKNEYTRKHYDRVEMILPKGMRSRLEEAAKEQGMSRNEYIVTAVKEKYMSDTGKELMQKTEVKNVNSGSD